jgi:hypothetical protein
MMVQMVNDGGLVRKIKVGFSWTAFFFGGIPFFFRGIPLFGAAWVGLALVTMGFSNLILAFIINKQTAHYYLEHGYKPVGEGWGIAGQKWGIPVPASVAP